MSDDASDFDDERDALAQALRARCPVPALNAALPWDTLTEAEREAWRELGHAAIELCGPSPGWTVLLASVMREAAAAERARLMPPPAG